MKIKKGDTVQVVRGKDVGKTSKVTRVLPRKLKIIVEGVNQYKRHVKARTQQQKSEIVTLTKPISIANVAVVCPHCKKPTRIGYEIVEKNKQRVCKRCRKVL
jgi:large subunit ribosomal protein L24